MKKQYPPFSLIKSFAAATHLALLIAMLLGGNLIANATGGETEFITFHAKATDQETLEPIAFSTIIVFLDGIRMCAATTDENGQFSVELPSDLPCVSMHVKVRGGKYFSNRKQLANTNDLNVCLTLDFKQDQRSRRTKRHKVSGTRITGCYSF